MKFRFHFFKGFLTGTRSSRVSFASKDQYSRTEFDFQRNSIAAEGVRSVIRLSALHLNGIS